ncbi:MAG TPA: G1 family glutamic endopeptidase [Acidobacteriaceae bacterium]|jgi:hypothetical protein|nr:G1 family glutamic endopeptidase [Acidobacteriaceae bacterium]
MKKLSLSLTAILALLAPWGAQAQTADSTAPPPVRAMAPHVVPTNIPGVYAFTQPPASFNPLTASKQELQSWGYSPRPEATEGLDAQIRWLEEVSPKLKRSVPDLVPRPGVYNRRIQRLKVNGKLANATAATSANWSGYGLTAGTGQQPFNKVIGRWTVPTVKQAPGTCSGGWDYSSEWVGIDGFNNDDLLQAGSQADVFCDIGQSVTEYFPWIEWLPESELVIYKSAATSTLYPFAPGDYLNVTVTATNFSGGVSTNGTLSFADVTQGWTFSLTFTAAALGGSQVTGASAEWIVERTEVGGSLATLPDYVANPWFLSQATDLGGNYYAPGNVHTATAYNITMLDNSNNPESFVDLSGSNVLWFFPEGSATQ